MTNELIDLKDLEQYGPAMQSCTQLERNFINAYFEHPNYSHGALAEVAGYAAGPAGPGSAQLRVVGSQVMHRERVIAAINEEASKRMRGGGAIGVDAVIKIALNPAHKEHLKAALALMDRTGFHAMTEHKVVVDDKRPQSKQELIEAVKSVARELGLYDATIAKMTGENVVDAEFVEVANEPEIRVEDL